MSPANEAGGTAVIVTLAPEPVELMELCGSLGLDVIFTFHQRLDRPDPRTFVGPGKLEEVGEYAKENGVDICVFNGELSPAAMFRTERSLGLTVYDRVRVILEIFRRQAASEEARLQVEMALLTQELPVLREWVHKARVGEHPGLMAGGEYDVRQYYTARTRRKRDLGQRLDRLASQRELRRASRVRKGLRTVSLAGYTNAGKTALMNAFTEEERPSEERLFTTLSTTTRRVKGMPFPVLLSDTIGFMEDLPPWLLESFRSTLEEVLRSDLMLLVTDVSDPPEEMARKLRASAQVIWTMGSSAAILPVFNKADLDEPPDVDGAPDVDGCDTTALREKLESCLAKLEEKRAHGAGVVASGSRTAGSLVKGMLRALDDGSAEAGDDDGQSEPDPEAEGIPDDDSGENLSVDGTEWSPDGSGVTAAGTERRTILRPLLVSARTGRNMSGLLAAISEATSPGDTATLRMDPRWNWRGMLSLLHDRDDVAVEEILESDEEVQVRVRCERAGLARALKSMRTKYGEAPEPVTPDPTPGEETDPAVDD